jgi:mono/diheme cytochrome c family protein
MRDAQRFCGRGSALAVFAIAALAWMAPQGHCAEEPPPPSAEKGHALAQKFCSGCHVIQSDAGTTVPAGIPPFRAIANRAGQTSERIISILIQPHAPMPDMHLSREEMLDIVAYLDTLRTDPSIPPLLPKYSPKPKYPEPS